MKSLLDTTEWKYNCDEDNLSAFYMPASVMRDARLSCKAKVVWSYMNSRPEGWDFSASRIAESMKEGYQSIQGAMRELCECNYLKRKKLNNGRMSYFLVMEAPQLTDEEAKQCLVETFPDYYVREKEFVCTNDAIEELKAEGWTDKKARATCIEWSKLCGEGGVGQSEQSWVKWKMHLRLNGGEAV